MSLVSYAIAAVLLLGCTSVEHPVSVRWNAFTTRADGAAEQKCARLGESVGAGRPFVAMSVLVMTRPEIAGLTCRIDEVCALRQAGGSSDRLLTLTFSRVTLHAETEGAKIQFCETQAEFEINRWQALRSWTTVGSRPCPHPHPLSVEEGTVRHFGSHLEVVVDTGVPEYTSLSHEGTAWPVPDSSKFWKRLDVYGQASTTKFAEFLGAPVPLCTFELYRVSAE